MKSFRHSNAYFIIVGLAMCLFAVSIPFVKSLLLKFGLGICIITLLVGIVDKCFLRYIVTEEGLIEKKLFKELEHFQWDKIVKISKVPDKKETYLIRSDKHYFFISPSIQNHKEMLDLIIEKCHHNEGMVIDL